MGSIGLASIRGNLYNDAAKLAEAKLDEYLAGRTARDVARDAIMQQNQEWKSKKATQLREQELNYQLAQQQEAMRLQQLSQTLQPALRRLRFDPSSGQEVISSIFPNNNMLVRVSKTDPNTGEILAYNVVNRDNGTVIEYSPDQLTAAANQSLKSTSTIGSEQATRQAAEQQRRDAFNKLVEETRPKYSESVENIYQYNKAEQGVYTYEDDEGKKHTVDRNGNPWTDERDQAARQEAHGAAKLYTESWQGPGDSMDYGVALNQYRTNLQKATAENKKLQEGLAELKGIGEAAAARYNTGASSTAGIPQTSKAQQLGAGIGRGIASVAGPAAETVVQSNPLTAPIYGLYEAVPYGIDFAKGLFNPYETR